MPLYLDDKKTARSLRAGDQAVFDRFFDDNSPRLYRFVLVRLNGDVQAAEDIAQTALARAIRKIGSYRGESALFTWRCAICRNEMNDWLRKQGRHNEHVILIEDFPEVVAAIDSMSAPSVLSPEASYQRAEKARLIQVALDRLPANYGDVLEWKYIEGYSVKEIAARLELGTEAAQSLIARAKKAFAEVYTTLLAAMQSHETAGVES